MGSFLRSCLPCLYAPRDDAHSALQSRYEEGYGATGRVAARLTSDRGGPARGPLQPQHDFAPDSKRVGAGVGNGKTGLANDATAGAPTLSSYPPESASSLEGARKPGCVFCDPSPENFRIVLEDANFVAFKDRSPAAVEHLLVVPRDHIPNVQSLTSADVRFVSAMQKFGESALDALPDNHDGSGQRRFGFHIPPFRSVDHLHLHCFLLPFRSSLRAFMFRVAPGDPYKGTHKGWSWFCEVRQAREILWEGRTITVAPC